MNAPQINVTPLIDVLLVLLIIFMVVTPLKPAAFKARIPAEPDRTQPAIVNDESLVVSVGLDHSISLNNRPMGSVGDAELSEVLTEVFAARVANGDISESFADDAGRPFKDRAERTVFIKAPKGLDYGSVAHVVDAVKQGGAYPISLQIDRLEN